MSYFVYRFYNNENQLIYTGRSIYPGRRYGEHFRLNAPHMAEAVCCGWEEYPTFEDAKTAEEFQILNEEPKYNIVGRKNQADGSVAREPDNRPKMIRERRVDVGGGAPRPVGGIDPRSVGQLPWGEAEKERRRARLREEGRL